MRDATRGVSVGIDSCQNRWMHSMDAVSWRVAHLRSNSSKLVGVGVRRFSMSMVAFRKSLHECSVILIACHHYFHTITTVIRSQRSGASHEAHVPHLNACPRVFVPAITCVHS